MSRSEPQKTKPFPIRLTFEERAQLEHDAAGMPLGAYVRSKVLRGGNGGGPRTATRRVKEETELARVLGLLGASRLSQDLNALTKLAQTGSLPVTQDLERELRRACSDIASMRYHLLKALGQRPARPQ